MGEKNGRTEYADIFSLPAHKSETRPHMSMRDRAAQFAPFAALTGFDEKIEKLAYENINAVYRSDLSDEEII